MNGLAVTVVVDSPGSRVWRACGKLWAASLLRHQWGGRVVVRRNFEHVLFPVERAGLEEVAFGKPFDAGRDGGKAAAAECRDRLLEAAEAAAGGGDWEWVLLADADCVALRNLDHLFGGDADLLVSRGGGAPDPGFVAVRGGRLAAFAAALREAGGLTAAGLRTVCASGGWRVREFERGEVVRGGPEKRSQELDYGASGFVGLGKHLQTNETDQENAQRGVQSPGGLGGPQGDQDDQPDCPGGGSSPGPGEHLEEGTAGGYHLGLRVGRRAAARRGAGRA